MRWVAGETAKTRAEGGWAALRVARPAPDERVRIGAGGSLDVAVYRPEPDRTPPVATVLLLHGNRAEGADAPLYRLLARRLAARGAVVYALSLPGFGRSNPIADAEPVTAARLFEAARAGIEFLRERSAATPRIVVGHSLGANLALEACSEPDLVVEAIEPGRRIRERVVDPPHPDLSDFVQKLRANVRGGVVDEDGVRRLYEGVDPERAGTGTGAKRCDVLYSGLLEASERAAVERIGRARTAEIVWLENKGHDFGAVALLGGVAYPGGLIEALVDTMLSRSEGSGTRSE
jgi:pimeloyl-ACP methyl ester carboxylesterase